MNDCVSSKGDRIEDVHGGYKAEIAQKCKGCRTEEGGRLLRAQARLPWNEGCG